MSAESGLYIGIAMLAVFVIFFGSLIIYDKKSGANSDQHKNNK